MAGDVIPPTVPGELARQSDRVSSLERQPPAAPDAREYKIPCVSVDPVTTGTESTEHLADPPFLLLRATVKLGQVAAGDVVFDVRRNGDAVATLTVAAGQLFSPTVQIGVHYGAGGLDSLDAICTDDGGGDFGRFTINFVAR